VLIFSLLLLLKAQFKKYRKECCMRAAATTTFNYYSLGQFFIKDYAHYGTMFFRGRTRGSSKIIVP
jgi:hypothetical protein